jgi:hypothetical protein
MNREIFLPPLAVVRNSGSALMKTWVSPPIVQEKGIIGGLGAEMYVINFYFSTCINGHISYVAPSAWHLIGNGAGLSGLHESPRRRARSVLVEGRPASLRRVGPTWWSTCGKVRKCGPLYFI